MVKKQSKKQKKSFKKRFINFLVTTVFLVGLLVLAYPFISDFYYRVQSTQQVTDFDKKKAQLPDAEIEERMKLAQAYNDSLHNAITDDPWAEDRKKKGRAAYARMLEINEQIGHVEIPKINIDIPIYAGSTDDVLQMGAGQLEGTSLPIGGNSTHSVITAHTGLPTAKLFTDLTKMEVGDKFYVHNIKETLAYQVDEIIVVEPSDFDALLIKQGHDYVTLLTCTPYGVNTHRLLVRGHRIPYVAAVEEEFIAQHRASHLYQYLFYGSLVLIAILLYIIFRLRKRKKENARKLRKLEAQRALGKD